jgi:quercetin dioxygenase-like cupin family protein
MSLLAIRLAAPVLLSLSLAAAAQSHSPGPAGMARPNEVLSQVVEQMPRGQQQRVRVLTATFQPGDRTVFHTHRSPVTVYVLEGEFTLELEGQPPVIVPQGRAYVEPPNVKMTGYNRKADGPLKVLIFYVSEPDAPFLDPAH